MAGLALGAIATFLILGYFGLPIIYWTIAGALLAWYLSVIGEFGPVANIVLATVFVVVAASGIL